MPDYKTAPFCSLIKEDPFHEDSESLINKLTYINEEDIPSLVLYKSKIAAKALKQIGYPRVKNIMPDLLVWLQDINWPVAMDIAELFVSIGKPALPLIKGVLLSDDYIWKSWIMQYVISSWNKELINDLKDELLRVAQEVDIYEYTDIEAMKILMMHRYKEAKSILSSKKSYISTYIKELNEL